MIVQQLKHVPIGKYTLTVRSWSPARESIEDTFQYVDLSSVDQSEKEIIPNEQISVRDAPSRARQLIKEGDILVSTVRPNLNGVAYVPESLDGATASTGLCVLRPDDNVLDGRYLFHWVRTPQFVEDMVRKATGQSYPAVSDRIVKDSLIPLPLLDEQRRIAAILDQADALRRARRRAIERLNDLGQAMFYEMFGDPATNPKAFPTRTLSEFYINEKDGTKCGPFGSALKKNEIVESGIPVWNMDNIDPSGHVVMPFRMWITEDKYRELESYSVIDGDIIISRAGTVGKMCVANSGGTASIISTNLIRVRFGADLLPIYFVSLMTYCKGRVGRLKTGPDGSFTHMSTGVLDKLKFPYPPVSLQRRFASIIASMEQQKALLQAHLNYQDTLFASLQHRAFCGDL